MKKKKPRREILAVSARYFPRMQMNADMRAMTSARSAGTFVEGYAQIAAGINADHNQLIVFQIHRNRRSHGRSW